MSRGNYKRRRKKEPRVNQLKSTLPITSKPSVEVLTSPNKKPKLKYFHSLTKLGLSLLLLVIMLTIGCSRSNSFAIPYTPVKANVSQYTINDLKISLDSTLDSQYNLVYRCIG